MSSRGLRVKAIVLLLIFVFLMLCSNFNTCNARRGKHWRTKKSSSSSSSSSFAQKKGKSKAKGGSHHHDGNSSKQKPKPDVEYPSPPASLSSSVFNVLDFGAKGDGLTDDTKAFQAAWAASCKVEASTMIIPSELEFLVGPISFSGPYCQPNIVFQLDGKIIAPTNPKAWGSGLLQWLEFTKLRGITIRGNGIIEGQGSVWWTNTPFEDDPVAIELNKKMPSIKPTALRFYGSTNVTVTGITIQNSPQCHLKFDNCESVLVYNMTVSSPGDSLNTDGIHLQNSRGVTIHHTDLGCGDDCISIQTGCSNVYIHNVNCGPGHGISIGGLGRDNTKACVSNITVQYINMHDTMNGVRIKTWQGGSGSVQNVRFSNIDVSEVQTPIIIDQFYCDKSTCKNQTSAVALSGIKYENIKGTYTVKPVHFACSDSIPCSDISLTQVELRPLQEKYHMYDPFCWKTYGELYTETIPPIYCLEGGKPTSNKILSDHDLC
ncbi:polygalacturonase At1g48100-like [Dioscorea cayenensis subsp. rotundata]|uniref:Polygalacturonase At1g48100-like n=1 Tax=Dioscorea cayennensis subsp. rotundata TaxID=55577 RepID=A0AB40AMF5_DIOCR|nr:polygalacturonase At1g48100-like [Dioscorea cayenensis subsp. rotundata]